MLPDTLHISFTFLFLICALHPLHKHQEGRDLSSAQTSLPERTESLEGGIGAQGALASAACLI